MKAMLVNENKDLVWSDVPDPVIKDDEVLVKIEAAALNRADLMQKDGCYSSPPDWPQWCGLEVSGIVLEAPEDAEVKVGDKVCALVGGGGYSEKIAVPAGMVVPIPEGLSLVEAASIPEVWCTAYLNLKLEAGGMKKGDVLTVAQIGLVVIIAVALAAQDVNNTGLIHDAGGNIGGIPDAVLLGIGEIILVNGQRTLAGLIDGSICYLCCKNSGCTAQAKYQRQTHAHNLLKTLHVAFSFLFMKLI